MPIWTDHSLAALPSKHGVRLRGLAMTRLETFCDAAFAFAVTLLVIAGEGIPGSYDELITALKGTPAFAASFAIIAAFWASHRRWSRRYGLEDPTSTLITLGLIFVMLVYVYPLKMVMSAFFAWVSGHWLPTTFTLISGAELRGLFIIYGVGGFAQTGLVTLLYLRVLRAAPQLHLDAVEILRTREEIVRFTVVAATCMVLVLWAALMPLHLAVFAGFVYMTFGFSIPAVAITFARRVEQLQTGGTAPADRQSSAPPAR